MKFIKILFGIALVVMAFCVVIFTGMPLVTTDPSSAFLQIVNGLNKNHKLYLLYTLPFICAFYTIASMAYAGLEMSAKVKQERRDKIKALQDEFYEALEKENYERCAEIRDEIRKLYQKV